MLFFAFLAVVGALIASAIGEPSIAFLIDLFTDPLWLFTIAIRGRGPHLLLGNLSLRWLPVRERFEVLDPTTELAVEQYCSIECRSGYISCILAILWASQWSKVETTVCNFQLLSAVSSPNYCCSCSIGLHPEIHDSGDELSTLKDTTVRLETANGGT